MQALEKKEREEKRDELPLGARSEPEWELLVHTRQFSYEWQGKDLRDTENGRVCKRVNKMDLESRNCASKGIGIAGEERT